VVRSDRIPTGSGDNSQEAPEACKRVFEQWDSLGMPRSEKDCDVDNEHNRLYVYGVMARLSLLAAALELEQTAP